MKRLDDDDGIYDDEFFAEDPSSMKEKAAQPMPSLLQESDDDEFFVEEPSPMKEKAVQLMPSLLQKSDALEFLVAQSRYAQLSALEQNRIADAPLVTNDKRTRVLVERNKSIVQEPIETEREEADILIASQESVNRSRTGNESRASTQQVTRSNIFQREKRIIPLLVAVLLVAFIASFHPYSDLLFPAHAAQSQQTNETSVGPSVTATAEPTQPPGAATVQTTLTYQKYNTFTNLTSVGTIDWKQWGRDSAESVNRKAGVPAQISDYTLLGGGSVGVDHTNPIWFGWSDGTPAGSVSATTSGIYASGLDSGFSFMVPANSTLRTLRVYVGAVQARGWFSVTLGTTRLTNAQFNVTQDPKHTVGNAMYTVTFSSSEPEQLTVYYKEKENNSNRSYVTLEAAALS